MLQKLGPISLIQICNEYNITKPPYKMSKVYAITGLATDSKIGFKSFLNKSNFIVLSSHTFDVYTTKTVVIPIANILENAIVGIEQTLSLTSVFNPINGEVLIHGLNVEFTSTNDIGIVASFQYEVKNNINQKSIGTVTMNVVAIPVIICKPNIYNLQQGESMVISKTSLLDNDIDGSGYSLNVEWVGNAIGGVVTLNDDNITFESIGLSGEPAGFEYKVSNNHGTTQIGNVYIAIIPLPEQEFYLYKDTTTTQNIVKALTPPTVLDIFNTWARFDGSNYYIDKSSASGQASHWKFLTNPDRVLMPDNTNTGNGFVSPNKLDNYTFEATLTSDNGDDDAIGLVIAFVRSDGENNVLKVVRNKAGVKPIKGWGIQVTKNGKLYGWTINDIDVGGTSGGWSNAKTRVKIQRQGDIITCYTTKWNDVTNYQVSSKIVLDLNSDDRLKIFKGPQSYGYYTHSQANSTYLDVVFNGGLDKSKIFDAETGKYFAYNPNTSKWIDTGKTVQDEIGYTRKVLNPDTNQRFLVKQNNINYLGKLVSKSNFSGSKILTIDQLVIPIGNTIKTGVNNNIQVVGLFENGKEEFNYLTDKPILKTTNNYQSVGYNYMGAYNWFEDNKIDISTTDFTNGVVVFDDGTVGIIKSISNGSDTTEKAYIYYSKTEYKLYDKNV